MEDESLNQKEDDGNNTSIDTYNVHPIRQCPSFSHMRRQSLLAAQMQKVLPDSSDLKNIVGSEKMKKMLDLHFSDITFRRSSMPQVKIRKRVSFSPLPRTSSVSKIQSEVQEHHIPVDEVEIHHSNLRELPFSIHEKRKYRVSIAFAMERKPWYMKFLSKIKYFCKRHASKFKLWNNALKTIEGQHGAGVVSYFLFIRWLLIMNALIFLVNFLFLILPHIMLSEDKLQIQDLESHFQKVLQLHVSVTSTNNKNIPILSFPNRNISKNLLQKLKFTPTNITQLINYCYQEYIKEVQETSKGGGALTYVQNLLQGTGWMETTLMFLGSYTSSDFSYLGHRYYVPVAFICTQMLTVLLCLCMMLM